MARPRLELSHVSKTYQTGGLEVEALRDVSLAVEAGRVTALVGRSGCGKTTLLNLAGAMDFPTAGEVLIDGESTRALSEGRLTALRRRRIGFVFQFFQLLPTMTVLENVELPLLLAGERRTREPALDRLRWVDLEDKAAVMPHQLSGGQMQRVAIARALAHSPEILIADEPTGNLDSGVGDQVLSLLRRSADQFGVAVLIATHSAEAAAIADRRVRLKDGRIAEIDPGVILLARFILRPLGRDLVRTLLSVLAVALGVGVVVAIDLAGEAAGGSFVSSLESLLGRTDLSVHANGGMDETWIARIAALPRNLKASPIIESQAVVEGAGAVPLYGVDLPSLETDACTVSTPLARRIGITKGSTLPFRLNGSPQTCHIVSVVGAREAEFVLLDIAQAQQALDAYGRLDRIDLTLSPGEDAAAVERELRALLPPGYWIEKPGVRSEENQRMLAAFRWNLRVLSYISLVVGAFLIYNTVSISVVRRRAEIGVLRALGASRGGVLGLFLGEALLLGLAGSLIGLGLGRFMAEGAVRLIAETVNSLYASSRPSPIELGGGAVVTALLAGSAVALLSALGPAREAVLIPPVAAMARGGRESESRLNWKRDLAGAAGCALIALAASRAGPIGGKPVWGYVSALAGVASAALATPAVTLAVSAATRRIARASFGAEGLLAARSLVAALPRTSVTVGALATAIAMMASVGIMVGSFRETVIVWLDYQLRADLYVRPAGRSGAGQFPALSPEVIGIVQSIDGVDAVDVFHGLEFRFRGRRAFLGAGDTAIVRRHGRLRFLGGQDRDAILQSLPGQDRVIVSEPFANKHGVHAGERIELPLGGRQVSMTVAGVYYDYSSELGYVILDRSTLLRYLPRQPPTNLAVYLKPGAVRGDVRVKIQTAAAAHRIVVADNQTLRDGAVMVFDRTFAITYALEAVAIIVAMLGAANSLLALVLDRRREMGMLRFLGASPEQLRRMVLIEAGFFGALANLIGMGLGLVLSLLLIYVINKQSFGWTIQFHPPAAMLAGALALIWCATLAAAWYPARVAARLDPIAVVHLE